MDTLSKEILRRYRDDSKFPNMNKVVYYETDALKAMDDFAIEFGNMLWKYLPYVNRQFQNPVTEEVFTIEQILNGEDKNYHEL